MKKYRLGNQSEEYELKTDYVGWYPKGDKDWFENIADALYDYKGKVVTLINSSGQTVELLMHQMLIKAAFPMSFYTEERAQNWHQFCMVSYLDKPDEKFIVPMH